MLVAVAGLTAFQARTYPGLSWAAFGLITIGAIVAGVGFVGASLGRDGFWEFGFLGVLTALIGSALFAIATYQTAALSRGAAVLVGVGSVLPFVSIPFSQPVIVLAGLVCFLLGWFLLGVQAIRIDRPASEPRPA
jgi:hypothetical protein